MKKNLLFSFCFLFLFLTVASSASLLASANAAETPVSPGLQVIAEQNSMAMSALKGSAIRFSAKDFARAMNLSDVRSVTITALPPLTDGELTVGTTVLSAGQTLSASSLELMSYTAKSDVTTSSFRFRVGESGYEMCCKLYLLDQVNAAPTLSAAPETATTVSTHRNMTLYGTLHAYDPEGDALTIEIVSYPRQGLLHLTNAHTGTYTYTPGENYTGKDSFTYVARDMYGNYSASCSVSLNVKKPTSSAVYVDMLSSPDYNAALSMTEVGIMNGTQIGDELYFFPDQTVSRIEFLTMAMRASGILEVSDTAKTVFADDADIPSYAKGYVATAYELGYIKGIYQENSLCLCPNEPITRADAALIVSRILNPAVPTYAPVLSDAHQIPEYASAAVHTLCAIGVLDTDANSVNPTASLTRADAADMLCSMMQLDD